jgi:hypothetical protein
MATPHATLTQLAQQAAAQIGFTPRRWWREATDAAFLRHQIKAKSRRVDREYCRLILQLS